VDWCTWSCQHCVDDASSVHIYLLIKLLTYFLFFMVTGLCHYTNSKCVSLLLSLFVHCLNSHFTLESSFISHPFHFLFVCCLAWTYTYIIFLFSMICGESSLSMISWEALLFLP
jgi:hypothetical protein